MAKMTGAQAMVESFLKEKVEFIFGLPGGACLPLFDRFYDAPLKVILTRHEQGAVHMAEGYARSTGKPGVVVVTSGPGATNTVTGIADAYMDSIPLVIVTGQVKTFLIGNDAFQEADTTGITRSITKHNYLLRDVKDLPRVMKEAFYIATTGRPGPVLVDFPVDVSLAEFDYEYPETIKMRGYNPTTAGHMGQIKKAAKLISESKRPVIYTGGGVIISQASVELQAFAEKINAPTTNTLMGLGGMPGTHPLFLGMLGMHGTVYANKAVQGADVLIAVGARFDDRVTGNIAQFAPHAKIVHIDIDPAAISKNVAVHVPIVGDVKHVLKELTKLCGRPDTSEWHRQIGLWRQESPLRYDNQSSKIRSQYVIQQLCEATGGDAIVTTDVGQHQMWAAQFYSFNNPNCFLTSGGLGTMGYGFPAAIGAQLGRPDKTVINITGDGSIQMNIQEMTTAVIHHLPIKIAILNNSFLGMVRQWQELFYQRRYSFSGMNENPDFVKLAEAYGGAGFRIDKKSDVRSTIDKALKINDRPVMMDFVVAQEDNVYPMVPTGQAIDQMIDMA